MTARLLLLLSLTLMSAPSATRILVLGHRGARALRPENTIPAFEYAIQQGADVLEMDVAVTRDNLLVISHDPEVNLVICRSPRPIAIIRELTLAELRQWDDVPVADSEEVDPAPPEASEEPAVPGPEQTPRDEPQAQRPPEQTRGS